MLKEDLWINWLQYYTGRSPLWRPGGSSLPVPGTLLAVPWNSALLNGAKFRGLDHGGQLLTWDYIKRSLLLFVLRVFRHREMCDQERMLRLPAWGIEAEEFEGCSIFVGALTGNFYSGQAVLSF